MSARRGRLISLEGGEGAGKSSVYAALREHLATRTGRPPRAVREPGGTPLGEGIRELLLHRAELAPVDQAELLLMFASRAQLTRTEILPALAAGEIVLSDRYTDASWAYQGGGRGLPAADLADCERIATGGLKPDLTLLLDVPPDVGAARIAGRAPDRIEAESAVFFERVRQAYLARAAADPPRFVVIDARPALADVQAAVLAAVDTRLREWGYP
jgi:dTMP kinase